MIRSQVGGSHAIAGSWGNASLVKSNWGGGLSMGRGMGMNVAMPFVSSHVRVPVSGLGYDHRLTGPYGSHAAIGSGCGSFDNGVVVDGGFVGDYSYGYDGPRQRRHKSSSKYKYYQSTKPTTNCTIM
jgi:hypothetical protein